MIAYLDEAAFNYRPHVRRTWAPRGQPPGLAHGPLWGGVQAISLVTDTGRVYFEVKAGALAGADVAAFLARVLGRYRRYGLLVILDGARTHHARVVRALVAAHPERLHLEYLPAYAPELNADEQVHGYIKRHRLANRTITDPVALRAAVEAGYEELAGRRDLGRAFLRHPSVGFDQISAA